VKANEEPSAISGSRPSGDLRRATTTNNLLSKDASQPESSLQSVTERMEELLRERKDREEEVKTSLDLSQLVECPPLQFLLANLRLRVVSS